MWPVSRFFSVVIVLAVAGCASWSGNRGADDAFEQALQLPTSTLGSNGLVLEVAQITVDRPSELLAEVWQATDEQHLPAATRKRLNDNGMRCGRLGVKLPTVLDTLIAESRQPAEDDPLNVTSRVRVTMVRTREGKEKELPVGATHPEFVVLRRDNDALRGETLPQAQCVLRVRPKWDGDGVNLSVSPGILYGQLKQSWAGQDGAWQLKSKRQRRDLDELQFSAQLAPGETLALTANEIAGAGGQMFTPNDQQQIVYLIRLAQTQHSELFSLAEDAPRNRQLTD